VVLAGLIAAQKVLGKKLADHTFLFLGAGEVRPESIILYKLIILTFIFCCLHFISLIL